MQFYKIGEFARMLGVSESTLRNYEKEGVLIPHHRSPHGYRYYSHEQYLSFLARGRASARDGT